MWRSFRRAAKDFTQHLPRALKYGIVAGAAALQFGCAALPHDVSSAPALPPESQSAFSTIHRADAAASPFTDEMKQKILRGMKESTNGQPFRMMRTEDFKKLGEIWTKMNEELSSLKESETLEQEKDKIKSETRAEMIKFVNSHTKTLFSEDEEKTRGWEGGFVNPHLNTMYFGEKAEFAFVSRSIPSLILLVLPDINNPLGDSKNLEGVKAFFEKSIGIKNVDKMLAPELLHQVWIYVVWHEFEHIGDPYLNKKIDDPSRKLLLTNEIYADKGSLTKQYEILRSPEVAEIVEHLRALGSVLRLDADHATSCELGSIAGLSPNKPDAVYVEKEDLYRAMRNIGIVFAELSKKEIFKPSPSSPRFMEMRYKHLSEIIQGNLPEKLPKSVLAHPYDAAVLSGAWKAWQKLEEKGIKMPVSAPKGAVWVSEAPTRPAAKNVGVMDVSGDALRLK